ncbi:MAG TPA: beta-propeller fold lactonase family protein [Verrucomicrobiae bacterium]|nr:beta-propeller fold lactonase family protein [Verrucomicrobiae bacterium]
MNAASIFRLVIIAAALRLAPFEPSTFAKEPVIWPGLQPDGSMLLPNQWSLRPAGTQIVLGDLPVNAAVSPDGKYAAVLHCGYARHEVMIVDLTAKKVVDSATLGEAFYGITFSSDGHKLFCGGASTERVIYFSFAQGRLESRNYFQLRPNTQLGVPTGLAVDPSGKTLYAADMWSGCISRVTLANGSVTDIPLGRATAPAATLESSAGEDFATAAAKKRARAIALANATDVDGLFPYACVLDPGRQRLYVSLWGASSVAVLDTKTDQIIGRWQTGQHPCEMVLDKSGKTLFVANANENTVTVLDTETGRARETLWATLFPNSPPGATPNSLALSPDQKTLFIANANIDAVAVFDVSNPGHGRCLGFIPTGWYPTSVRLTPDGKRLLIANGKGNVAMANPEGPQPVAGHTRKDDDRQYIAGLYKGTLSIVDLPKGSAFVPRMSAWTADVLKCTPLRPDASVAAARPPGNPIPDKIGNSSPIKHCIYIIKENRTYDQIFGDIAEGNGDPKLCLFPENVTPNLHNLVKQFVLLDNFYAEAEVSASGHEWSMGAIASDFVEKTWPLNYGHKKTKFPYPGEGIFPIASPKNGYLWDRAAEASVSYRSYGEFVQSATDDGKPGTARLKTLQGHFDPWFHGFGLDYPDWKRADRFISELKRFESEGDMPALQIVRLPNDHTHGVTPGELTPTAYVADNDAALGKLVDAVTHSIFWTNTAIFVVEDDAQNGPDHVDAHRTEALVISPYTRHAAVDSTLYSTTSMLRTMELILGLQPMTQFDAAATPMFNSFQEQPDFTPYTALPANVSLTTKNSSEAWGAHEKFYFAKEDANDDIKFNEVIWRSVKGSDHPMPAPVHAGFVLAGAKSSDDDGD